MKPFNRLLGVLGLSLIAAAETRAQWLVQSIDLRPGWNAVYLEVDPSPRACDAVFTNLPVESVWAWNRRFSPIQYIQDPTKLVPENPDWLMYVPPTSPAASQRTLFALEGGRPYLIKLAANAPLYRLNVPGNPVVRAPRWLGDSLNFVGCTLETNALPPFQRFFAASTAHAGQPVYRLDDTGKWMPLAAPATTLMRSGEAFWIWTHGPSDYAGPIRVELEQRAGLQYGRILQEQTLRIINASTSTRTLILKTLASADPPSSEYPSLAGSVPLSYWRYDASRNTNGWAALPAILNQANLPPGGEWELRLAVRRSDMAAPQAAAGSAGMLYQSLLELTDSLRCCRHVIPVTSEGLQNPGTAQGAGFAMRNGTPAVHPRAGLWVGSVVVNQVNQPASLSDGNTPTATASEFQFRLLIHVNAQGQARLLQKVLQMWANGAYITNASGLREVAVPGHDVLLTDESQTLNYTGAALIDGQPVGRRLSSAAFSFQQPIPMSASGDFGAGVVTCEMLVPYNDPLNPFVHRYHPDHNNLNELYEPLTLRTNQHGLTETSEAFSVKRRIQLTFSAQDPESLTVAGWGDNQLGGTYRETLTGLHKNALQVQGIFRLHHVSRVPQLN